MRNRKIVSSLCCLGSSLGRVQLAAGLMVCTLAAGSTAARAAVVATYPLTGSSLASTDTDANSTASDIAAFTGVSINLTNGNPAGGPAFSVRSSDTKNGGGATTDKTEAGAVSGNTYFSFSVTPGADPLNFTTLTFDTNPFGSTLDVLFFLRTDAGGDNFATTAASAAFTTPASYTTTSLDLSGVASLQGVTSPVNFRLYMADSRGSSSVGTFIDNITLNSTPEPTSLALLGIGSVTLLRRRQRA